MPGFRLSFAAALEEPVGVCFCVCQRRHHVNALCPAKSPLELQLPWQRTKRLDHVSSPLTAVYISSQGLALCVYTLPLNLAFDIWIFEAWAFEGWAFCVGRLFSSISHRYNTWLPRSNDFWSENNKHMIVLSCCSVISLNLDIVPNRSSNRKCGWMFMCWIRAVDLWFKQH